MKVRLLRPTAINNGFYLTGSVVDLQPTDANLLVSRETAELVEDSKPETKQKPKKPIPPKFPKDRIERGSKTKEDKLDMVKFAKFAKGGVIVDNDRKNKK